MTDVSNGDHFWRLIATSHFFSSSWLLCGNLQCKLHLLLCKSFKRKTFSSNIIVRVEFAYTLT